MKAYETMRPEHKTVGKLSKSKQIGKQTIKYVNTRKRHIHIIYVSMHACVPVTVRYQAIVANYYY